MSYLILTSMPFSLFFFNYTATTQIYTLSLHDALPIYLHASFVMGLIIAGAFALEALVDSADRARALRQWLAFGIACGRSEEHTSELQSQSNLVCRLLLEKKKKISHQKQETRIR